MTIDTQLENERKLMVGHLLVLREKSGLYLQYLSGEQDSLKRFLYCCTEKIYKCSLSIQYLYSLVYEKDDIEFSIGIILRSLLMDSLLTQYLRFFTLQVDGSNYQEKVTEIKAAALQLIADGTGKIISDFLNYDQVTEEQKKVVSQKLAGIFPDIFYVDKNTGIPKVKKQYKVNIEDLHRKSKHDAQYSKKTVYELYSFYSKYDHVSHWTSILGNISEKERLFKVHSSIVMILYNLQDLLVIGQFHDELKPFIPPILESINNHFHESYVAK